MFRNLIPLFLVGAAASSAAQAIPTEFVHDRIYVVARAPDGWNLRFYTDSGGGWNAIGRAAVDRLKLPTRGEIQVEGGQASLVDFPDFLRQAGIPSPSNEPWLKGRLVVAPDAELMDADGFLGTRWFAGHVWQIDYPAQTLTAMSAWSPSVDDHPTALGFRSGPDGKRNLNFPRITISIDGNPIDVLFDTGATAELTEESAPEFRLKPGTRIGASYVIKSIFESWQTLHPNWRVIERAEAVTGRAFPMIEVPQVTIAGITFGPVWFTQRPDAAFRNQMSQMMDKQVVGAIGGSGLKYLRLVLDYPGATAYLHEVKGASGQAR